jgi:hypothetical protein
MMIWLAVTAALLLFTGAAALVLQSWVARRATPPMRLAYVVTIYAPQEPLPTAAEAMLDAVLASATPSSNSIAPLATPAPPPAAVDAAPRPTPLAAPAAAATEVLLIALAAETPLSPAQAHVAPAAAVPAAPPAAPPTAIPLAPTPAPVVSGACPTVSGEVFGLIEADGTYKGNQMTDQNADLRLSVLGYQETSAPLNFVTYDGPFDGSDALRFDGFFEPNRIPQFVRVYQRRNWSWNEGGAPPYGAPSEVNTDWPVSVIDFGVMPGEGIYPAERLREIGSGFNAMVLYAAEDELTLAYYRQDSVGDGFVIYLRNFCVDPNLVSLYRAQLNAGRRATGRLPAVRNNQRIGVASGPVLTVSIRDRGTFLDPRSQRDWWP